MKPSFYLILILCLLHSGCLRESYSSKKEDGSLVLSISGNEVLSYRYETMPPPMESIQRSSEVVSSTR